MNKIFKLFSVTILFISLTSNCADVKEGLNINKKNKDTKNKIEISLNESYHTITVTLNHVATDILQYQDLTHLKTMNIVYYAEVLKILQKLIKEYNLEIKIYKNFKNHDKSLYEVHLEAINLQFQDFEKLSKELNRLKALKKQYFGPCSEMCQGIASCVIL